MEEKQGKQAVLFYKKATPAGEPKNFLINKSFCCCFLQKAALA
jgi:hypothetical protein